ncbi:hypothetical protein ACFW1A_03470 [Kitasatospora sp. NPDC058965]|uniref:hypothetical protein n=1 Tax=Kitasatospora sp. NPDC058965 TaxID=3346682 RepID=UPI00368DC25A
MMQFYVVRPEVPGQLGENTVLDRTGERLRVSHLHYAFDGWLGDELITSHPAFAATTTLAEKFLAAGLTGVQLRDMEVTRSEQFEELYPDRTLPDFVELVVTGAAGVQDFGIDDQNDLVLSQPAVDILNATGPLDTEIIPR